MPKPPLPVPPAIRDARAAHHRAIDHYTTAVEGAHKAHDALQEVERARFEGLLASARALGVAEGRWQLEQEGLDAAALAPGYPGPFVGPPAHARGEDALLGAHLPSLSAEDRATGLALVPDRPGWLLVEALRFEKLLQGKSSEAFALGEKAERERKNQSEVTAIMAVTRQRDALQQQLEGEETLSARVDFLEGENRALRASNARMAEWRSGPDAPRSGVVFATVQGETEAISHAPTSPYIRYATIVFDKIRHPTGGARVPRLAFDRKYASPALASAFEAERLYRAQVAEGRKAVFVQVQVLRATHAKQPFVESEVERGEPFTSALATIGWPE